MTRHDGHTARLCEVLLKCPSANGVSATAGPPGPDEGSGTALPSRRTTPHGTWTPRELPADTDDALC